MNNYIDIKVIDPDQQFMMNKLFTIVHALIAENKKKDIKIAVSFPYWTIQEDKVDIGDMIRLFSEESVLESIKSFEAIKVLAKHKAIKLFDIKPTPITNEFIMFYRDRTIEKNTPAFKRRQLVRVEKYKNVPKNEGKKELSKEIHKSKFKPLTYFFKLKSESTGQESFSLFIACKKADALGQSFNSYGLAINDNKEIVYGVPYF